MTDILFTKRLFTSSGSGGGTGGDYNQLSNRPKINSVTLSGNKTTHQLGMFEQVTTMPTASSDYANKAVQYLGESTTTEPIYEQGNFYICEENAGTYSWNHLQVEQIATASDFGLVKPDGTTITINNGVITAQGTTGAKLYTLDGLSITSTNTDIRTLVQAVVAKNLPIGSIVTGSVQLTDAPADNMTDAMVEIVAYQITEGSSTDTIYDITLNSRTESPYQWHAEYWVNHPTAGVSWVEAPLAFWNMPTASATYGAVNPKIAQYVGPGDGVHVTGKFYKCQEVTPATDPATYEWVLIHVEPVGSSSDFGIVKVDNSSIIANNGVITANKATGAYSTTFVGNASTTNSSTNVGANSTAHGHYSLSLGCDAVCGDPTNDVRVPGAIQLGRGTNTTAGSMYVGLSNNGTTWNNYQLLDSAGLIPSARIDFPVDDVQVNGTSIVSSGVANVPYAGTSNAGVIKTNTSYGTSTNSDGVLQAETKTNAEYNNLANTIFIGKGTLENVLTGKGIQRTTVADTTSTSATLSIAQATDYTFSQNLVSLTISSVPANMMNEATVTFTTGSTFTMTLPASGLTQLGSPVVPGANQKVVMSFWNGYYVTAVVDV